MIYIDLYGTNITVFYYISTGPKSVLTAEKNWKVHFGHTLIVLLSLAFAEGSKHIQVLVICDVLVMSTQFLL